MDRAEIESDAVTFESPAGEFTGCLRVVETTPLESGRSVKIYAPEVGLVFDDGLVLVARSAEKKPPAGAGSFLAEVEIPEKEMPAPVAAAVKKAHPDGKIREVKRESHTGGKTVYAIEVMVGDAQYDVEVAPDGTVLQNKKE
jgi:hypothetical protein